MINLREFNPDLKVPKIFDTWKIYYCENDNDIQWMRNQWLISQPFHFALDTETDGLNVAENGSKAFLMASGWIKQTSQGLDKQVYVYEPSKSSNTYLLEVCANTKWVWAFNSKFDLNILRNTDSRFRDLQVSNWGDGRAVWRLAADVDIDHQRADLKHLASQFIPGAKQFKDDIATILSKLQSTHRSEFKDFIFQKNKIKLTSDKIKDITNFDVFSGEEYQELWLEFLQTNPQPNYYSVYQLNQLLMSIYVAGDVIYLLELIYLLLPLIIAKQQVNILLFENKLIEPLANQERNGLSINFSYLVSSKKKVLEYFSYIESELIKKTKLLLENSMHYSIIVNDATTFLFQENKKRTKNEQRFFTEQDTQEKIDNYNKQIKNQDYRYASIDWFKLFMYQVVGVTQRSWEKTKMNEFYDYILAEFSSFSYRLQPQFKTMIEFIDLLRIYRRVKKWANTYIGRWIKEYHLSTDGRIHPSFNPYSTVTGRMSSDFQQQPKDKLYDIRKSITLEDGMIEYEEIFSPRTMIQKTPSNEILGVLVADLAQIEIRVNAEYTIQSQSPDYTLINSIIQGTDMHTLVAAEAFHHDQYLQDRNQAQELVTKEERNYAKNLNFLMQYGGSKVGIRKHPQLSKIPEQVQDDLFQAYQNSRQGTIQYQKWAIKQMQTNYLMINGKPKFFVENMYGRRYYASPEWVNGIKDNPFYKANAYKAINYLIQGTCAYALKSSLIKIDNFLSQNKLKSKLLTNIHDEVQVEIYQGELWIIPYIKKFMEDMPWATHIPVICDLEWYQTNWSQKIAVEWDYQNQKLVRKE